MHEKERGAWCEMKELKEAIEKYIVYYNEKRIKKKLGWKSPVEYRQSAIAA